jgi:RNA polymerase sigma-70 factor (ECF subfamily)
MSVQDVDVRLIQRAAKGDADAFATLFDQNYQAVYSFVLWQAGDPDLAEDITQETFIRAHAKLHRLGPPWKIRAWLFQLARNLYIDQYRRKDPSVRLDTDIPLASDEPSPERQVLIGELSSPVKRALRGLSLPQREALVLREVEGFPYADIAEVMGVSLDNVKVMLHRARASFKEMYTERMLVEEPLGKCEVLNELLDSFADFEHLSPEEERIVSEHIQECDICQQRRREIAAMGLLLRGMQPTLAPKHLRDRVLKRTANRPEGPFRRAARLAAVGGAGGLITAVLWLGLPLFGVDLSAISAPPGGMGGGGEPAPTSESTNESTTEPPLMSVTPESSSIPAPNIIGTGTEAFTTGDDTTTEVFPVYYCTQIDAYTFQWYEVEVTYVNGEPVSEAVISGPYTGLWQSGCPAVQSSDSGGGSDGDSGGGAVCTAKSCGNGVCEPACGESRRTCRTDCP